MVTFLMRSAAVGVPLTASEVRRIHAFHLQTLQEYADFPNWDLWDPSVPDGVYSFRYDFHPRQRPSALRDEDLATLVEYCWSPFTNPAGAMLVDCDIIRDPTRWGEEDPCPDGFEHIPAGTFDMGTPEGGAVFFQDESPVHSVEISRPFCMQARETTQAQWLALMGNNPSQAQGCDECPVEKVNSYDAMAYCNALGTAEGLDECYDLSGCTGTSGVDLDCDAVPFAGLDCNGYRLPTEAEWEYAARAGSSGDTWLGDLDPDLLMCEQPNSLLDPVAWFCGNSDDGPKPVGMKTPNPWGLYDILGNVFEWCWDLYQADYYAGSPGQDPTGPDPAGMSGNPVRMIRGGSWQKWAWDARASSRSDAHLGTTSIDLGFRPVRSVAP
jgi:formylglycine-generating enzyme required for sulfatase activity